MNILMLGWELPPHNSGGLGVACYQMAKQLAIDGVTIDFVVPYRADHGIDFMTIHHAIDMAPEALATHGAYDSACYSCDDQASCDHDVPTSLREQQQHYIKRIEQIVAATQPDVIHAHDWLTFEAGIRAKELTGKPLVAHVHATEFDRSGEHHGNPLVHEIEYNGLLMADRIIAVSQITKDIIVKEYNIPADKIEVVHNSVDVADYQSLEDENTYRYLTAMKQRGYTVVVSVGRLTVQKGYRYLLEAAKRAIDKEPKLLFMLAGSGELRDELLLRSAELGIAENVLFTGFVRGKAWRDVYTIGDIFIMPSVSEPFGLVALEAAGHHNAVLLSKQSGAAEVLHNVLKFDFWDTETQASQIVDIAHYNSLKTTLTDMITYEFNRLSWQKAADQFQKIYSQLSTTEVLMAKALA